MNNKTRLRLSTAGLFTLILVLATICFLRYRLMPTEQKVSETEDNAPTLSQLTPMVPESSPVVIITLAPDSAQPSGQETPEPAVEFNDESYDEVSYQIVSDLVYLYRQQQKNAWPQIEELLIDLQRENAALGDLWRKIISFWDLVNSADYINIVAPPADLPQDESLCVLVLGFQLLQSGDMAPELAGRCETALSVLQAYPNCFLAVTGGGTAVYNPGVTEAGVMAKWFTERGISPERIIIENHSLTTVENAKNTCEILVEQYPQVNTILLVTSDYHVPLGALLFQEASYLQEYKSGKLPYMICGNYAFASDGGEEYLTIGWQATDLWSLANPTY